MRGGLAGRWCRPRILRRAGNEKSSHRLDRLAYLEGQLGVLCVYVRASPRRTHESNARTVAR